MSLRSVDDSDPLLAFDQERGAADSSAPLVEPAVQPVAAQEDRSPIQEPSQQASALTAKVESLERTLDQSKSQFAAMQSEMATLVRTVADIRKRERRAAAVGPPFKPAARSASAVVGLMVGILLGIGGWLYFEGGDDVTMASPARATGDAAPHADNRGLAPTALQRSPSDTGGLAPTVVRTASREGDSRGQPPPVARTASRERDSSGQPPAVVADVGRVKYVGTLSIDADPGGRVFVDRQPAGHTPLRLTNLRAGSHLIWIERDGYRRFTRVVQVPANRVSRLSVELEPLAR